jgi:hypothetical protein
MTEPTSPQPTKAKRIYSPSRKKVPAFARYQGTSAWRKDRRRVRAYALYMATHAAVAASA